ncbi:hypothetical protein [Paenibacillus ihumii]|uniref:hypothetical protein n=1 Tax=Paenibacillus ihumii TaxID=687436 RepID=UPI000B333BFB|nr:hypothetical protein [Paenibacillus ihumii]
MMRLNTLPAPLYAEPESRTSVLNGFMVVNFCGKEREANLNGFYVVRRREIAIMGWILDF